MKGVHALHRELTDKHYRYGRPGIEAQPWGDELTVHDPFGNRIRFNEDLTDRAEASLGTDP